MKPRVQLDRGKRITEIMKQKQYAPLSVAEQGAGLFLVEFGHLDDVADDKVSEFEAESMPT